MRTRHDLVSRAFADFARTLSSEFDTARYMGVLARHSLDVVGVASAGIMVRERGVMRVIATTDERVRDIQLRELRATQGPSIDAARERAEVEELTTDALGRWPVLAPRFLEYGYRHVAAFPLGLGQDGGTGALTLFRTEPRRLDDSDRLLAEVMAGAGTIGLSVDSLMREARSLVDQLQTALDSRVIIEQAKGILAERLKIGLRPAFEFMRNAARVSNRRLADVAQDVVEGRFDPPRAGDRPTQPR